MKIMHAETLYCQKKKKKYKRKVDLVFLVVEDNERLVSLEGYGVTMSNQGEV
jgi:hypothetical protein